MDGKVATVFYLLRKMAQPCLWTCRHPLKPFSWKTQHHAPLFLPVVTPWGWDVPFFNTSSRLGLRRRFALRVFKSWMREVGEKQTDQLGRFDLRFLPIIYLSFSRTFFFPSFSSLDYLLFPLTFGLAKTICCSLKRFWQETIKFLLSLLQCSATIMSSGFRDYML